jgi:hypothetical protein
MLLDFFDDGSGSGFDLGLEAAGFTSSSSSSSISTLPARRGRLTRGSSSSSSSSSSSICFLAFFSDLTSDFGAEVLGRFFESVVGTC